jgi:2-polyprenyl-3-methyl-5-hydroxy-6-metoxy-1,4-benzoquinol methylase
MALTEDEIRPHRFASEKRAALQRDLNWLEKEIDKFIFVACPVCGSDRSTPEFQKYGFHFVLCEICYTAYMNPRAPADILAQFYKRSELYRFWNEHIFPASREARRRKIFRPRVDRLVALCKELGVSTETLIDVGAGNGIFCEEVKTSAVFKRVVAVEPSNALAATCRSLGIETIERPIEAVGDAIVNADVITSYETIEHLFSPIDFLTQCRYLLKPGGLLILTCPNYQGFDIQALGVESDSLDAEHINLLNPDSLQRLAVRSQLRVVECSTPGELDAELVRQSALDGHLDLSGQSFLKTILLDQWESLGGPFQRFLRDNRLSSHMWLVAQKRGE